MELNLFSCLSDKIFFESSGAVDYILSFSKQWQLTPLLFAWLVTAFIRVTIGSATVAAITASGIVAPLVAATNTSPELMVLAVGSGSVFMSHVNDTTFWMFKEFFNLTLKVRVRLKNILPGGMRIGTGNH